MHPYAPDPPSLHSQAYAAAAPERTADAVRSAPLSVKGPETWRAAEGNAKQLHELIVSRARLDLRDNRKAPKLEGTQETRSAEWRALYQDSEGSITVDLGVYRHRVWPHCPCEPCRISSRY